jgi:predicted aspartyl protease
MMKSLYKAALMTGLTFLSIGTPAVAQIANGVDFTTTFPFYAGNAKMPAGSYKISQTDIDSSVLQIQSSDGAHSALVEFIPTHAEQPHSQSDVTFHKYGDTDYLNRIWVNGQRYGMKVDPTKAETKAAANASAVEHSIVANNR